MHFKSMIRSNFYLRKPKIWRLWMLVAVAWKTRGTGSEGGGGGIHCLCPSVWSINGHNMRIRDHIHSKMKGMANKLKSKWVRVKLEKALFWNVKRANMDYNIHRHKDIVYIFKLKRKITYLNCSNTRWWEEYATKITMDKQYTYSMMRSYWHKLITIS